MAIILKASLVALLSMSLVGCSRAPRPTVFDPTATVGAGYEASWAALLTAMDELEIPLEVSDKAAGRCTSEWFDCTYKLDYYDCGRLGAFSSSQYRDGKLEILIEDDGSSVRLTVQARFREMREDLAGQDRAACYSSGHLEQLLHRRVQELAPGLSVEGHAKR